MTNSQFIDRDALNDHLTPARRKHCLKALGIHFNGHAANADGEVSGLKLPPSIHDDTSGTAMRAPSAIPPRPRTATATKYPNVTRPYLRLSANRTAVISAQR